MPYPPKRVNSEAHIRQATDYARRGILLLERAQEIPEEVVGCFEEAMELFEKSLQLLQDQPDIVFNLGFVQHFLAFQAESHQKRQELFSACVANLRRSQQMNPDDVGTQDLLGSALFQSGVIATEEGEKLRWFDEAIEHLQIALKVNERRDDHDPDLILRILELLGLSYCNRGLLQKGSDREESFLVAVKTFERAFEFDPDDLSLRYNYGNSLLDVAKCQADPDERKVWQNRSQEVHEKAIETYYSKSELSQELRSRANFDIVSLKHNFACLLALKNQPERAVEVLREIQKESPERIAEIVADVDLISLHDHPGFQALGK